VTEVPDAAGPSRGPRALPAFGAAAAPGSLESLRGRNRERVLSEVRRRGATSRVDIVRETGLSRSTVSSLVGGLITEGLLVERPERSVAVGSSNGGGRPATVLTLNPVTGGVDGRARPNVVEITKDRGAGLRAAPLRPNALRMRVPDASAI